MVENEAHGLFNRLIAKVHQSISSKLPTDVLERALYQWKDRDGFLRQETVSEVTPVSFPDQVLFRRFSLSQRQRLASLIEEMKKYPVFGRQIGMYKTPDQEDLTPLLFRDGIFLFLTSLSSLKTPPPSVPEDSPDAKVSEEGITRIGEMTLDQSPDSSVDGDWIKQELLKEDSFSCLSPEEPFTFSTFQDSVKDQDKTCRIRMWDFITLNGRLANPFEESETSVLSNNDWNQRNLSLAIFDQQPTSNPLISGFTSPIDGHCDLTLMGGDSHWDGIQSIPIQALLYKTFDKKEKLEEDLIHLMQLALDGNVPAIKYLESSKEVNRAKALHKLMTKITKAGYLRHELDRFLDQSRDQKQDPIQTAFLDSVSCILRWHSSALQNLTGAIKTRQEADNGVQKTLSILEAVLHTEKLRKQVCALLALCRVDDFGKILPIPEGHEILSRLYTDLLEADNQSSPMIRYLFCCCFRPFHVELRNWLYSTKTVQMSFQKLPVFLESIQETVLEVGQQLRVLSQVNNAPKLIKALISGIQKISESELNEMKKISVQFGDQWASCKTDFGKIGFSQIVESQKNDDSIPLPFRHDALHETIETLTQASIARYQEIQHLINVNRRIKKLETEIKNAEMLKTVHLKFAEIEDRRQDQCYYTRDDDDDDCTLQDIRRRQKQANDTANASLDAELGSEMEIEENQSTPLRTEIMVDSSARHRPGWDAPEMSIDDEKSEMVISEESSNPSGELQVLQEIPKDSNTSSEEVLVPISAVLDGCILQPISEQHRCISFAFSDLFCDDFGFLTTANALRQFYFAESGDWIANLAEQVFSHLTNGEILSNRRLFDALETAFLESTYQELVSVKDRLGLSLMLANEDQSLLQDPSSQSCTTCLKLEAKVNWPLSLVLDEGTLEQYNTIFQTLMKLHQARWWLSQIWTMLQKETPTLRTRLDANLAAKLKKIRLWNQDAVNIVTTLQSYIHHELHFDHWQKFKTKMEHSSGLSLMKIKALQEEYTKRALETCFLTGNTRRLRSMMESSLQSIVNFCSVIKESAGAQDPLLALLRNERSGLELEKLFKEWRHRTTAFYKTIKYRANRGECTESLLVLMSFNSYYGPMH